MLGYSTLEIDYGKKADMPAGVTGVSGLGVAA